MNTLFHTPDPFAMVRDEQAARHRRAARYRQTDNLTPTRPHHRTRTLVVTIATAATILGTGIVGLDVAHAQTTTATPDAATSQQPTTTAGWFLGPGPAAHPMRYGV